MENLEYLNQEIIAPLTNCIGLRIGKIIYSDLGSKEELTTDNDGVDIISYQAILEFENKSKLFFSWNSVKVWDKYTIGVSEKTFFENKSDQTFENKSDYAKEIIGRRLINFRVFGYGNNEWTTYQENGKKIKQVFHNQPHLIVLNFEGNMIGVANFYREEDFEPKLPMGDDIWIIYTEDYINKFIEDLGFEELYKYLI